MNPHDLIRTTCTRCNGTGLSAVHTSPGRPKRRIPCAACEQRGYFERSIAERCERLLAGFEPAFCARRDSEPMALEAIRFTQQNPWCKISQAIQVAYQSPEFHSASTRRQKRHALRAECAQRIGRGMGIIPSRRTLLERLAERMGTSVVAWAVDRYRQHAISDTILQLLTPGERTAMLYRLGFGAQGHAQLFNHGVHPKALHG